MSTRSDILDAAQATLCAVDASAATVRHYGSPVTYANSLLDAAGLLRMTGEEIIALDDAYRAAAVVFDRVRPTSERKQEPYRLINGEIIYY